MSNLDIIGYESRHNIQNTAVESLVKLTTQKAWFAEILIQMWRLTLESLITLTPTEGTKWLILLDVPHVKCKRNFCTWGYANEFLFVQDEYYNVIEFQSRSLVNITLINKYAANIAFMCWNWKAISYYEIYPLKREEIYHPYPFEPTERNWQIGPLIVPRWEEK